MICSHRCSAEEGTSAPLLPEKAEEVWNEPQHPQILLHLHLLNGEIKKFSPLVTQTMCRM